MNPSDRLPNDFVVRIPEVKPTSYLNAINDWLEYVSGVRLLVWPNEERKVEPRYTSTVQYST